MSEIKKFINQFSHYFSGNIFVLISGLISFPILTRIFTVEEYGVMSLVTSTIEVVFVICCAGLGSSIIRFYGEYRKLDKVSQLYSTTFFLCLMLAIFGTCFLYYFRIFGFNRFLGEESISLLSFSSSLIVIKCMAYVLKNCLRAEERTFYYNIVQVLERYSSLGISLYCIIFLKMGLYGFYLGIIIGEGIILLWLLIIFFLKEADKLRLTFSFFTMASSLAYSLPIVFQNFSSFLVDSGDRYLIQYYMGFESVGVYSVGYTFVSYIQSTFVTAFNLTIVPIVMNIWEEKGRAETVIFLRNILKYYCLIALPIIFGVIAIGNDLLVLIASEKYSETKEILPYVISGLMINGGYFPLFAGIFIYKKTYLVAISLTLSALLNIILNYFLIPTYGITGAAVATVVSYVCYILVGGYFAFKLLPTKIPYRSLTLYLICSVIMYFFVSVTPTISAIKFFNIGLQIIVGVSVYCCLVLSLDKKIRLLFLQKVKAFR